MKLQLLLLAMSCSIIGSTQPPSYVPTDNLLAWYPFDGDAIDESFNGNNGTLFGGVVLSDDRFSSPSSAHNFDGVPLTYINCGNDPSFDITTGGSVSISAWIKLGSSGSKAIVGKSSSVGTNIYGTYGLNLIDRVPRFIVSNQDGLPTWYTGAVSPDTLDVDVWYHLVGIADLSALELRLYVDGNLVATNAWGGTLHSGLTDLLIGCRYKAGFGSQYMYNFYGDIDDVAIWDKALDQCEIVDLYTAGMLSDASKTGAILSASLSGMSYQWLDCDDSYAIILGETNQNFSPPVSGNYAVEVTMNGCVDTSECFLVDYTSLPENLADAINFYPNPSNGILTINTMQMASGFIQIRDALGKVVSSQKIESNTTVIQLDKLVSKGTYFVEVLDEQRTVLTTEKIIYH